MSILKFLAVLGIMLASVSVSSGTSCLSNVVSACSSITDQSSCESAYIQVSSNTTQNYSTTYCSNCGACISGYSDCISGDLGCNACQFNTNQTTSVTGINCTWSSPGGCSQIIANINGEPSCASSSTN